MEECIVKKIRVSMFVLVLFITVICNAHSVYAEEIRIGVIDTGINDQYFESGQISEGKNYVFENTGTKDILGHGTRIASLILRNDMFKSASKHSENMVNKIVLIPLVYQSKYPSGVLKNSGVEGLCKAIYDGINVYDCKILCISSGINKDDEKLSEAIAYAEKQGVIVVAAVGNDNIAFPERLFYPAAYETVIGVGSIDDKNVIADFSQRSGVSLVDFGVNLNTINHNGEVSVVSGTSYSTGIVVGTVARLLDEFPTLTPKQVREILFTTANDLGEKGYDEIYGWGTINLEGAIRKAKKLNESNNIIDELPKDMYFQDIVYA